MHSLIEVSDGISCLDLLFQSHPGVIAAYLLEDAGERVLIEIGPTSTLDALISGLDRINVDPSSISKILVTHIHLDHAGASGTFLRRYPGARLYVHEVGAPHMVDPSRLVSSATRIYGDEMDTLWGAMEPVPEDRITILTDGDIVAVGRRRLGVLYTPGHASHHVAFYDEESGTVFTGDAAAVRIPGYRHIRAPTPPPDIDLELWDRTFHRLGNLHADRLCLTHFGPFSDVRDHLTRARERLWASAEIVHRAMKSGQDAPEIVDALRRHGDPELLAETDSATVLEQYELACPYGMSVDGLRRYFRNRS